MIDYREKILQIARIGPILPSQVAQTLGRDLIMASAMLSEMVSKGLLKVSFLKIGSSPLYYTPSNEGLLVNYTKYLNEKDQKTAELLRQSNVLREKEQDPLTRVSLKNIKDFAKSITVQYPNGEQETFWRWYLISDEEAEKHIKTIVDVKESAPTQNTPPKLDEKIPELPQVEEPKLTVDDSFLSKIQEHLAKNKITLKHAELTKKNTDADLYITITTPLGELEYYCKAKNKKKITESDIHDAYVQGQIRRKPVILLTNGELNKKASELLNKIPITLARLWE